ncbi:aminopeptidase P N-terminal domain-containing protein [Anaeromyxobacter dehalogenans]|uniref:Xaa-Pro aminopeptidase n=1 Tax=Anaeromyxobacter dehalogenans (strain 2CP-C) TaxID=290397 RepID=Q2IEP9_ANADE|nr:aminopeptidase P N-terminal domain-containing protein [Anaeromyxobacter dehalogenans]ABC83054.1 aminopeptidase P, Metallo peptidase, MEROPS family M24B [Anaeromyxobacter dehalogenans 2CP-C]
MAHDLSIHAARRARVFEEMEKRGGGVMVLPAADEKVRNHDSEYLFRQDSDYAWAIGLDEPTGCAVLLARGGERKLVLFVRPRDREKEIWTGRRAGVEGAKELYGADEAYVVSELEEKLPRLVEGARTLWCRIGFDAAWDARLSRILTELRGAARLGKMPPEAVVDPGRIVHELRLVKTPDEIAKLRRAAEISAEAHMAAMRDGLPGRREYQVQSEIEYAFRRRGGSGPGYGTIVAAGVNSTILHYRAGDAVLKDGDVCLVDAGGEYQWYTADVTRTFPVSGEFSPAQAELYSLCLDVQKRAVASVRPGTTLDAIHDQTVRELTDGLIGLGLLKGSVDERIADKSFRRYYMHRTSHWLGMDVHDVGDYYVDGKARPLVPGMVLTIEPGLYVAEDDPDAPAPLRGVGIRIEDDVLVTDDGHANLTEAVPKEIAEMEAVCVR